MNNLIIPLAIIYAGLAGTILALLLATAFNRWSPKVFFLLALRLAIGWHFLFEGLYKIQSHDTGPSETSRPFSSEPYFRVAPGPIGAYMRRQFDDPATVIDEKVKRTRDISPEAFAKLPLADQAAACPTGVARQIDDLETAAADLIKSDAEKQLANAEPEEGKALALIRSAEEKALKEAKSDAEKAEAKTKAEEARKQTRKEAESKRKAAQVKIDSYQNAAQTLATAAKAAYARWVYGVDGRNTKVKFITGDVALTAPERLAHIERLKSALKEAEDKHQADLGNGQSIDSKHAAELRTELITAETDLARDANAFVAELKKDLTGTVATEFTPTSRGQQMDAFTMWFLVAVGSCLMAGLLTRVACVLAAGFLVMTYLAHPAFPWYPLPPNTEGNPVFINKNVIECLALLALACMPSGRWLGLDAILLRPFTRGDRDTPPPAPPAMGLQNGYQR
jgi:uncharacterized membrane protein YphA (DoxX/SURF4 family)